MLEATVTQGRPYLWHLAVELSPGPGAMELDQMNKDTAPRWGPITEKLTRDSGGKAGAPGTGANVHLLWVVQTINCFLMKVVFSPPVSLCQAKEYGATLLGMYVAFLWPWFFQLAGRLLWRWNLCSFSVAFLPAAPSVGEDLHPLVCVGGRQKMLL